MILICPLQEQATFLYVLKSTFVFFGSVESFPHLRGSGGTFRSVFYFGVVAIISGGFSFIVSSDWFLSTHTKAVDFVC